MSYFILSALVNTLSCGLLGLIVYLKDKHSSVNRAFFLYSLALTAWSFSYFLWQISSSAETALFWAKILMFGAILIPITYIKFAYKITKQKESKFLIYSIYIVSFILLIANSGNYLVSGVESRLIFQYWPIAGPLYPLYLFLWFSVVALAMVLLLKAYLQSSGKQKTLYGIILAGNIVGYAGGATNYPLWFNISILPWGNILVSFYSLSIAYAIIAHQLFDIRVIIRRTFIYSGLLAFALGTYSMVIFFFTALLGNSASAFEPKTFFSNLIAAGLIALGFDPLRRFLQEKTDSFLYKKEFEEQVVLQELGKQLNSVIALDEALEIMMQTMVKVLHLHHAVTFVFQIGDNAQIAIKRIKQIGYGSMAKLYLDEQDVTFQYFNTHPSILTLSSLQAEIKQDEPKFNYITKSSTKEFPKEIGDELRQHTAKKEVVKKLTSLSATLAIPLKLNDQPLGLILLSGKLSGDDYSKEEIAFLETIGSQAIASIQKAKLYEGDQMKSEFVSIASHELLTPISAIEGYLSMILDENIGKVDPKARGYLEKVYTSSKRLSVLIKDLLSVSRIEAGKMKIEPQSLDANKVISDTIDQLKFIAENKKLKIEFTKDNSLPAVWADSDRATQVMVNLVSNAIKYTPAGSISITASNQPGPVPTVQISVTDTGMGMTKDAQSHLFEKFYRVATPETTGIIGTGLGLYITKSLVERMGGVMSVKSVPNKGSTFSFTLPVFAVETSKKVV